jgi:hypothetical protein
MALAGMMVVMRVRMGVNVGRHFFGFPAAGVPGGSNVIM